MKLSSRLRSRQWKAAARAPGDHAWEYSDDPVMAADLLDECEAALQKLISVAEQLEALPQSISPPDAFAPARAALAKLHGRPIESDVTAFYVREDHKRRALPLDVDAAIDIIREEFIAGHSRGSLCAKDANSNHVAVVIRARGEKKWAAFEIEARAWLASVRDVALKKTLAERSP